MMIVRISALMLTAEDRMWAASKTAVRQVVELMWVILRYKGAVDEEIKCG